MSENEGESRSIGAFLLGFLTGVLVCVGVGGGFFFIVGQKSSMAAREAMMEAERARAVAEEERLRALQAEQQALAAEARARKRAVEAERAKKVEEKPRKGP
jgi:Tfp pilus assembly protein PilN